MTMPPSAELLAGARESVLAAGIPWLHYEEISSTNDRAKALLEHQPSPFVVTATAQRKGRGSKGRGWVSEAEMGLYYSLATSLKCCSFEDLEGLHQAVGKASIAMLRKSTGIEPDLEWPNDIIFDSKKLGGILLESVPVFGSAGEERITIIGIGLNLNHMEFPDPLAYSAISLAQISGKRYNAEEFVDALTKELCDVI